MKIPVITGPTATGKTDFVLKLSEKIDLEIISADAYQVYKYMDIGTAKPTIEERKKVKHHLIDILLPDKSYSAGDFFENAQKSIKEILTRGKLPVVVGGTGLYVETLVQGIFKGPSRNEQFRKELRQIAEEKGVSYLYKTLKQVDPEYADKISDNDFVRICRALEVYDAIKIPFSKAHKMFHQKPQFSYKIFVFYRDRNELYDLINRRVDKMFELGWIEEVESLLNMGYNSACSSFKAIGYSEIEEYLVYGGDLEAVKNEIKKKTRRFAKRQLTWFRHMRDVKWIHPDEVRVDDILSEI